MNKKTKKAIEDSITHWHENLSMLMLNRMEKFNLTDDVGIFSESCPLCKETNGRCEFCPLAKAGFGCKIDSNISVWANVSDWYFGDSENYEIGYQVISKMINTLYKLID